MAEKHSVSALKDKYARIIGEANALECEAARLREIARSVGIALQQFAPEWTESMTAPIQPRKPTRWGVRGGGIRIYLDILRRADRPLTSLEIATKAIAFDPHGKHGKLDVKALVGPINKSLVHRVGKDVVLHPERPRRWSIARR